ncbi:hypothetical protein D9758_015116 [Tetrapyrgos nigripes]|uniref:Uncharacterized protein n=1 Tax=Tetrapyrgos nigripes TaxID=182062 RepID=A0A8H5BZN5_9AGAR|nr:hypothetical protein D9758_015116 [Tetrapyrgos nigripes]
MSTSLLRAPRAPIEQLCLESTKILTKLQLIAEFTYWLDHTFIGMNHRSKSCLIALLHLSVDVETFDFQLGMPDREKFFANFIQRVHFLEIQGKPRYGEVLTIEDLFGGTSSGFMKVLKTVQRLLDALQATYPGLSMFPDPTFTQHDRRDIVMELVDTERAHVSYLLLILDSAATLSCASNFMQSTLEPLVINDNRLSMHQYHDRVLKDMEAMLLCMERSDFNWDAENWLHIFGFDNPANRTNIAPTYHSLSVNYLDIFEVLPEQKKTIESSSLAGNIQTLLDVLSILPARIADYCAWLQAILDCTLPSLPVLPTSSFSSPLSWFDTVCITLYYMSQISSAIDEMSWQIQSIQALRTLNQRAFHWNASIDPSQLGNLLVDDQLKIYEADSGTGLKPKPKDEDAKTYQVFLFETMLLCCLGEQKLQKHRRNGSGSESRSTRKGDVELDPHAQKTGTAYSTWVSWTEWTRNGWSSWGRQRRDLEDVNG